MEEDETEQHQRIKWWWMGVALVVVALFIDIVQALLTLVAIGAVLSPIITVAAGFVFWIWFNMLGVSYITSGKRLATFAAEWLGELLPVVDALPLWTIGTIITIIITRSEDKGGVIGKAAHVAQAVEGAKAIGTRRLENLEEARKLEVPNEIPRAENKTGNNTLDLKNKNKQPDNVSLIDEKKQKQQGQDSGNSNQLANIDKMIRSYRNSIAKWQEEIWQLERKLITEKQDLQTAIRSHPSFEGEEDPRLRQTKEQVERMRSNISSLGKSIDSLKESVSSANNKILELEKQRDSLDKMQSAA